MQRRSFLKIIGLTAATAAVAPKMLIEPLGTPGMVAIEAYEPIEILVDPSRVDLMDPSLWGLVYYQSNATTGSYLGIRRS